MFSRWLQQQWFAQRRLTPALWLLLPVLWPLSLIYAGLATLKRCLTVPQRLPVPVVVVGNIIVGGAGKTPLTLWLAQALSARGRRPGIVSRGYGGSAKGTQAVGENALAAEVGDEPVLLARRSGLPVWVGRDRVAAGRALLKAHPEVDVLLCDDGLQHHRLARDVELLVFDRRGAGNECLLPLGPLREGLAKIPAVDAVVGNDFAGAAWCSGVPNFAMVLHAGDFYALHEPERRCSADDLAGRPLHALAGIGDPGRFFATLTGLGLEFVAHAFPDHHAYCPADMDFGPGSVLLMTEKDAVKCAGLPAGEAWVLPVEAELPPALVELVLEKIRGRQVT